MSASAAALHRPDRSPAARYALGIAAIALGMVAAKAFAFTTGPEVYTPLIGAVAIAVWFGGIGPALLAVAVGWGWQSVAEVELGDGIREDETRWLAGLAVALTIVWVTSVMRAAGARAAARAAEATRAGRLTERLQELASELSAAVTPADVAGALVARGAEVVGSGGGALALVVGDELEIVDPGPTAAQIVQPGRRLPLQARTAMCTAVRTGELVSAATRAELAAHYPDGLELAPSSRGVIAAPLLVAGTVVGAIAFHYMADGVVDEERLAYARLAADLGGQALERARLYDDERALREGLDRALRVAPMAGRGSPEEVTADICREARRTLGSDVALMLSILDDERFVVDWRDPPTVLVPPGLVLPISDLPDLRDAMAEGTVMWVPDLLASLDGEALEIAHALGTVSALRVPITLSGRVDRILVLQWEKRVTDPTPALLALVRRFADQAGLAFEQAQRLAAEESADRRRDETRSLLETTTALAAAKSTSDVVDVVLGHGALALGADAGVAVVREGDNLVVVGATGLEPASLEPRIALAEPTPLADAVRRNETVVIESSEDLARRYALLGRSGSLLPHQASVWVPLTVRGAAVGGVGFGFERARRVDDAQRQLVVSIVRQAAEALERARLHEAERGARSRAERAAARLAQLHALGIALGRARTQADVADAVGRRVAGVVGARSATLYVVDDAQGIVRAVGRTGAPSPTAHRYDTVPLSSDLPLAAAVRSGEALWSTDERAPHPDEGVWKASGAAVWGVVPIVVQGRTVGALAVSFDEHTLVDDDSRRFVETAARYAGQPFDRVGLLEAEQQARVAAEEAWRRMDRLQTASASLAVAVTTPEIANTALEQILAAVGSQAGLLYLRRLGVDQLDVIASAGVSRERLTALDCIALSESTPVGDVMTSGAAVELRSAEDIDARYPSFAARTQGALPAAATLCLPIAAGGRALGAVLVALDARRLDDDEDRDLVRTLADLSGEALERARLLEAEQAATTRLQRLHAMTAALSGAVTVEEVGRATLEEAAATVEAPAGAVVLQTALDAVDIVAAIGGKGRIRGVPLGGALAQILRKGRPAWGLPEGHLEELPLPPVADSTWSVLPLRGTKGVIGALVLGLDTARPVTTEERSWLESAATQCAQALERSRLYDVERELRERVERLHNLTTRLSASLTPSEVGAAVLAAGKQALGADSAALVGVGEDGTSLEVLESVGLPAPFVDVWRRARLDDPVPGADAIRERRPVFLETRKAIVDRYHDLAPALDGVDDEAWAIAPLLVGDSAVAALTFGWREPQSFEPERRMLVDTLARQCAQALDRARKHESERQIAETLQRSMLPDRLPDVPGVALAARYVPGVAGMEIGGDWFDAVLLGNGRLGLAVGDVVGKGVGAASTMGQLRNALRAFALDQLRPATTVARLNALLDTFADVPFATLVYLTLDPVRRTCRYTVAGHPPPILVHPDGRVERLEGGRSLPLGVEPDTEFAQSTVELEPGATIVLYTDGLVERPGRAIESGFEALERSLGSRGTAALDPEALAEHILRSLLSEGDPRDDVALLVVKLAPVLADLLVRLPTAPEALVDLRGELRGWLRRAGADPVQAEDITLACWEACANAIEHGSNGARPVDVELSLSAGVVSVRVSDAGTWRHPVVREGRGFGLRLIRTLMDSVRVEPAETGTVVRMTRTIAAA